MERTAILATMGELKLYGMRAAFDAIITTAVKRQHEPQQVIGDFVSAEIAEKQARSIKYQITTAKLPLAKDVDEFGFVESSPKQDGRNMLMVLGPHKKKTEARAEAAVERDRRMAERQADQDAEHQPLAQHDLLDVDHLDPGVGQGAEQGGGHAGPVGAGQGDEQGRGGGRHRRSG